MDKLKSVYQVSVSDQRLTMQQIPRLASGAVGTVGFAFTGLDAGNWAGRTFTAVFWRSETEVYHVLTQEAQASGGLTVQVAVVPAAVMAEQGAFWLGLMGTAADGTVLPTEAIRLNVFQGAITTPTADPAEPTPDVYAQLLQGYASTNARLSEVIAMRGGSGETVIEMSGDDYVRNGTIRLNGASAVVTFEIDELALDGYGEHSTDGCIQPAQAPLFPEGQDIPLHCDYDGVDVTIKRGEQGWSYIKIINTNSDIAHLYGTKCWGFFPLASVTVPELADARVDRTGKVWPTVGDHLRAVTAAGMYYKYDFNGDGVVNEDDYFHLLYHVNNFNVPNDYPLSWWSDPDVDGDGDVDLDDAIAILHLVEKQDPAAFELLPKEESILDGELNGTSVRPVQNKAIGQGVANALKGTASGAVVALTDVSPLDHELTLQLKNKNLIPPQSYNEGNPTKSAGVTFTYNEDGSVLANGTATGNTAYYICQGQSWEKQMPLPRGTYTLSGSTQNVRLTLGVRASEGAERVGKSSSAGQPLTFTVDNDTTRVDLVVCVDIGKTADNEIVHPQLEAGSVATTYTPHVADFSEVTLTKQGKNLYDSTYKAGNTGVYNGWLLRDENSKWNGYVDIDTIPDVFTLSTKVICDNYGTQNGATTLRLQFYDADKNDLTLKLGTNATAENPKSVVVFNKATVPSGTKYVEFLIRINSAGYNTDTQIELGTTATEYEPYKEPEIHTPETDGTVRGVTSLAPTTTLATDTAGVTIDATYNRDTNKVIENLEKQLTAISAAILNA